MRYSVHNPEGSKVASVDFLEDGACLVALYGDGATIRYGRHVLWTEGKEANPAGDSYDAVRDVCQERADRIDWPGMYNRMESHA